MRKRARHLGWNLLSPFWPDWVQRRGSWLYHWGSYRLDLHAMHPESEERDV